MTSVFDTHPPLYMSQFLLQKKLCFETGTHPPFGPMSQNTQFFFEGFPNPNTDRGVISDPN